MTLKLFHTADLHLTARPAERDYGLSVLDELVYHAKRLQPAAVLLCGDIFDSPEDLTALAAPFAERLSDLEGLPVLMIPGNHELAGGKKPAEWAALARDQLAPGVTLALEEPFQLLRPAGLEAEVLALPFRPGYSDYMDWPLPPPERRWRIGLLHGTVNGMAYTGDSAEDEHGILDPHLLNRLGLHYAALGHIHARGEAEHGGCLAHYPGSARVWRRGEAGARRATLVTLDDAGVRTEPVELAEAGQYHHLPVPLDEDARPIDHEDAGALVEALAERHGPSDWLRLELQGFVEARAPAEALQRALERAADGRFRAFEVGLGELVEGERLRGHPLVRSFDALWRRRMEQARTQDDQAQAALLDRARRLALEAIQERLEAF